MLTNVALAAFGTRVLADSYAPWYRTWPVHDGRRNELDEEGRWGKVRWLSAPTPAPHWLQVLFPGPQPLTRLEIYWARDQGRYLMPRQYLVEYRTSSGWSPVPEERRTESSDGVCTVIDLVPVTADRLRLYMPAGGGLPGDQVNVLGVAEFEAYSPTPFKGEVSTAVVLPAYLESRANPFWLNWAPAPGATGYRLEYSQSAEFPAQETFRATTAGSYYTPGQLLAVGRWYWRVAPLFRDAAGEWSEAAVADVKPGFTWQPKPAGSWKATHPRLPWSAINREKILAEAAGPKQAIWEAVQQATKAAVPHVAQIRNMQDSGAVEEGLPAEPPDFDDGYWTIDRWREIVGAGAKVEDILLLNSFVYAVTGATEAREKIRALLLHASQWDAEGSTSIWNVDHAAHDVLLGLAAGYDTIYHDLTPAERQQVRGAIVARCRSAWRFLNPFDNDPNNNHPWFHTTALAVGAMAVWDEVPEADEWVNYAIQLYVGRFLSLGGVDGEWHEGSDYWTYSLGFVFDFCDAVHSVTGIDLYQHPWIQQTAAFKLYVAPPGGPGLSVGDTHRHAPNGEDAAQMFCLARANQDGYAQWYGLKALEGAELKRSGLLLRLMLWWDTTVEAKSPAALPQGKLFRDAGLAYFHTTLENQLGTHFALHSGHFHGLSGGHSHADQNHFMLYAGGEPLVIDSGCYDYYGSPHFNQWYIQTPAHNTILVNGKSQVCQRAGTDGRVSTFLTAQGYDYLVADASNPAIYNGLLTRFQRHVVFLRPSSPEEMGTFVLLDDLSAPEPSTYDWLLHTHANPEIQLNGPEAQLLVQRPAAHLHLSMRAGSGLVSDVKQGFPKGAESTRAIPEEWHTALRTNAPQAEQTFVAVLDPHRPDQAALRVEWLSDRAVRIGESEIVAFGGRVGPWETDGRLFAVRAAAGSEPDRWLAAGATRLTCNGKPLLEAVAPVTLSWWRTVSGEGAWTCQSDVAQSIRIMGEPVAVEKGETTR